MPAPHIEVHSVARMAEFDICCQSVLDEYDHFEEYFGRKEAAVRYNSSLLETYATTETIQALHSISRSINDIPPFNEDRRLPLGWHFLSGASLGIHLSTIMLGSGYDGELVTTVRKYLPHDTNNAMEMNAYVDDLVEDGTQKYSYLYKPARESSQTPHQTIARITPLIDRATQSIGFGTDSERLYQSGFVTICDYISEVLDNSTFQHEFNTIADTYRRQGPRFSDVE